jgi:carbamoyl-phosphate synthase large subunit
LKVGNGAVVLAYGTSEEEKQLRLAAAKYRLLAFSEEETFKAYLQSLTHEEITIASLQQWLGKNPKGVTTI